MARLILDAGPGEVLGVGLGMPGLVTAGGETVYYGELPQITGATAHDLGRYIPFPVRLFHNASAAARAEARACGNIDGAFYLMLGDNISGVNCRRGNWAWEGNEVGHITLVPRGRRCFCGRRGCVNAYCGAAVLSDLTGGDLEGFFQRLRERDPGIRSVWETYLRYLAETLSTLHTILDGPIILGGFLGAYVGAFLRELRLTMEEKNGDPSGAGYLRLCRCKTEPVALGAALPYTQRYLQSL